MYEPIGRKDFKKELCLLKASQFPIFLQMKRLGIRRLKL